MKTKFLRILIIGVFLTRLTFTAEAVVRAVTLTFVPTTADYVVPIGKVLLIEHISAFYGNSFGGTFNKVVITIASKGENDVNSITTIPWSFTTSDPNQSIHLDRPLRAAAGSSVNIFDSLSGAAKDVRIQGLLVDEVDLYAANLGIDVQDVDLAAMRLTANVKVSTSRPVIIDSVTSRDLQTWADNLSQLVTRQPAPMTYNVSTEVTLAEMRKFLRVSARTPELP